MYVTKIWRWRNIQNIEEIQEKYMKWMLGLKSTTPTPTAINKERQIKNKCMKRALKFEKKNKQLSIKCTNK